MRKSPNLLAMGQLSLKSLRRLFTLKIWSYSYGEAKVLDGVNLEIKKGEVVALVGASGSEKLL